MQFNPSDDREFPISRFESMLKTNHVLFFDAQEFEMIASYYLDLGKIALSKKAVKLGLQQHPDDSRLTLLKIELFIFENKLKEAKILVRELKLSEPYNDEIYIQEASVLSKQNAHKKAIETLENALELDSDEIEVFSLIAMEYLFLDDYESAKYYFFRCLEQDEEDYAALYNVMFCFDMLDQREEAIAYLNMLLDKNPYCEIAWHQLGLQYSKDHSFEKALGAFEFAIIADENFLGAYMEKGKVLEYTDRYEEAIANYQMTLELHDPTAFAYLRIGKCFEALKQSKLALNYYEFAIDEDPLLDKSWIALAEYYLAQKNYRRALHYINRAISIDEENVLFWKLFGKINHRLKFLEKAEMGYRKSIELGNYELETWLTRADLLIVLQDFEQATYALEQAREFHPENAEIQFRLAGLYFMMNAGEKGYYFLNAALKIDPEFSIVLEELFPNIHRRPSVKEKIDSYTK